MILPLIATGIVKLVTVKAARTHRLCKKCIVALMKLCKTWANVAGVARRRVREVQVLWKLYQKIIHQEILYSISATFGKDDQKDRKGI